MSVLLLSLASPDESSLVRIHTNLILRQKLKIWDISNIVFNFFVAEIRSRISSATTMVRSQTEIFESKQVRLPERHPPPQ